MPQMPGQETHVRRVSLGKAPLINILGLYLPIPSSSRDNRYVEITCTLCGYTEFYNLALYVQTTEEAEETAQVPLPERPKGA